MLLNSRFGTNKNAKIILLNFKAIILQDFPIMKLSMDLMIIVSIIVNMIVLANPLKTIMILNVEIYIIII